jgi:hypothetical protein
VPKNRVKRRAPDEGAVSTVASSVVEGTAVLPSNDTFATSGADPSQPLDCANARLGAASSTRRIAIASAAWLSRLRGHAAPSGMNTRLGGRIDLGRR